MSHIRRAVDVVPFSILILLCVTLGLAPFTPEPHVWEKLKMLTEGTLAQPVDILDLAMHGLPWLLLVLKLALRRRAAD
jgi:hypothetical protein